jgi:hypothetical protein
VIADRAAIPSWLCPLKQISYLTFKEKAQLFNRYQINFLSRLFVEQGHRGAAEARFSGNISNTHLVLTHHAGEMAADHSYASSVWFYVEIISRICFFAIILIDEMKLWHFDS